MISDAYTDLRERLDDFASGYPTTESGIEIKILKALFTENEAELFLELSPLLERPEDVSKPLNRDPGETAGLMERMAKKGLIFRQRKDGTALDKGSLNIQIKIYNLVDKDRCSL